jgi:signal transduction histidine kinase
MTGLRIAPASSTRWRVPVHRAWLLVPLVIAVDAWVLAPAARSRPPYAVLQVAVSVSFLVAGSLLALDNDQLTNARLLALTGVVWVVPSLSWRPVGPLSLLSWLLGPLCLVPLGVVFLRYPYPRLSDHAARTWVVWGSATLVGGRLAVALFSPDRGQRGWWFGFVHANSLRSGIDVASNAAAAVVVVAFCSLVVRRLVRTSGVAKQQLWPVAAGAWAVGIGTVAEVFSFALSGESSVGAAGYIEAAALLAVPMAFVVAGVMNRIAYADIAQRLLDVGPSPEPARLRTALAGALRDPDLELFCWDQVAKRFVAAPAPRSSPTVGDRLDVPIVSSVGTRLALVRTHSTLELYPRLTAFVMRAVATHLEAHASFTDRLPGLADSIDVARASERQRLERNVHDGTQQRLVGLIAGLRALKHQVDDETGSLVEDLTQGVRATLEELRELVRGNDPPLVADEGLGAALLDVIRRLPVHVGIVVPPERLSRHCESDAYFIVCEALSNLVKHSGCTDALVNITTGRELSIDVYDNGARPGQGNRSETLRDRTTAAGGSITTLPGTDRWTNRLRVTLPLA